LSNRNTTRGQGTVPHPYLSTAQVMNVDRGRHFITCIFHDLTVIAPILPRSSHGKCG
jgi:hypothetical protein